MAAKDIRVVEGLEESSPFPRFGIAPDVVSVVCMKRRCRVQHYRRVSYWLQPGTPSFTLTIWLLTTARPAQMSLQSENGREA